MRRFAALALLLLVAAAALGAEPIERFPPPDLGADYVYPQSSQAPPREAWKGWMDGAVLLGALVLAAWLVLKRRSRRGIVVLGVFSILYFGFYRRGCVCPIGAVQNVAQGVVDPTYIVPLIVLFFFALPLIFAFFFGRVFCAAVCPFGALQDLALVRPVHVPRRLELALGLLRYFYLGLAVLFAATSTSYIICLYDPFIAIFRFSANWPIWILTGAVLLTALFVGRPYCRYLCPYGVLLGLVSRFSLHHATTTPDRCIHCDMCHDACPFNTLREGGAPEHAHEEEEA